ncbi:MAG: hypothetical protein CL715_02170 [Chloroflexi bacterium]|nr:hypothetical protein [Chloroflexota bacterium]|tara:strand:- start:1916 stop:2821 length:906 start_codon:yes stop_codon:yes gene_type:complete
MNNKHFYGGQAVIEGVMIRGKNNCVVAVRNNEDNIILNQIKLPSISKSYLKKIPLIRGFIILVEMMIIGYRSLTKSSEIIEEDNPEDISTINKIFSFVFSTFFLLIILSFFFLVPLFLSDRYVFFNDNFIVNNFIEGIIRFLFFIAYIFLIGLNKDVKRVFAYHGAEHKTIAAYEKELSTKMIASEENINIIQKYRKEHPRCGTSFLMTVILVSIIVHVFIPREPVALLYSSRLFLFPIIAALSYEIIRFSSVYSNSMISKFISYPNLMMQKLTTAEPDDDMVEVAISAINESIKLDEENN